MSPGDAATIAVYATQWGNPLPGVAVALALDESMLQTGSQCQPLDCAGSGTARRARAPRFPASVITDETGVAVVPVTAQDPGTPRTFKDGKLHRRAGVRPPARSPPTRRSRGRPR